MKPSWNAIATTPTWPTRASRGWSGSGIGWRATGAWWPPHPRRATRRIWTQADRRWASGKRQIIEGVIGQLKDLFGLERHRAKTLDGLLARLATKIAAYTYGQRLNDQLGRPLRHLADLLV